MDTGPMCAGDTCARQRVFPVLEVMGYRYLYSFLVTLSLCPPARSTATRAQAHSSERSHVGRTLVPPSGGVKLGLLRVDVSAPSAPSSRLQHRPPYDVLHSVGAARE
jgi:hypothetical protein